MTGLIKYLAYILILVLLFSCGGGGQDGTGRPPSSERQVTSVGTINSESKLTVNGVEYDASGANVIVDNESSSSEVLGQGQIVTINGTLDENGQTGIASTIIRDTNIFGPVSLIDVREKTIEILGQTIRVNDNTFIEDDSSLVFQDIQVHDHLRVIGFVQANGDLSASYIERVTLVESSLPGEGGNPYYEVNGRISNLNVNERVFKINDQVIDYSHINSLEELENGRAVEVLGASLNNNQFIATSIRFLPEEIAAIDTRVELEGFITVFRSIDDFEVNGTLITTDESTEYIGGDISQLEDNRLLALLQRLEVEGTINSNGILVAEKVIFLVAHITSHKVNDKLGSDTITFSWTDVQADEYGFHVSSGDNGISSGGNGQLVIYEQYFDSDITSATVSNLPINNAVMEIAIGTKRGERWFYQGFNIQSQSVLENAELLSHAEGDMLTSDTATFTWSDVGADEYRLLLFTGERSEWVHGEYYFGETTFGPIHDIYYSGDVTSVTVDNLPINDAEISLVLFTRHGQGWAHNNYQITSQNILANTELASHADEATLQSSTETFSWLDVNADEYRVELYSADKLLHAQTYSNQTHSITLNNLPINGAGLNMRLYTRHGIGWRYRLYNFTSHKILDNAVLLSHIQNEQLDSDIVEFSWSDVAADEYEIRLFVDGSLLQSQRYNGQTTSAILSDLPTVSGEIRLDLLTRHGPGWATETYRFFSR